MKEIYKLVFTFALISFLLSSCTKDNSYKIAVVYSTSIINAGYTKAIKAAAKLRVDEANAGKYLDKKLTLEYFDNKADIQIAKANARKIVKNKNVVAVLGYVFPKCLNSVRSTYTRASIPVLTPAIHNLDATDAKESIYRCALNNANEAKAIVNYTSKILNKKNAVVIYQTGKSYEEIYKKLTNEALSNLIILSDFKYKAGEVDFKHTIKKIKTLAPESLIIIGNYREAGLIVTEIKNEFVNIPTIVVNSKVVDNEFITIAGSENAKNVYGITSFLYTRGENESVDNFNDEYAKLSGRNVDRIALNTYEAFSIIIEAIRRGGRNKRQVLAIIDSISSEKKAVKGLDGLLYFKNKNLNVNPIAAKVFEGGTWIKTREQIEPFYTKKKKTNSIRKSEN